MQNPFLLAISTLNAADVRYVIVGGFAAFLHGTRRATVDLDVVVDLEPSAARKAVQAFLDAGFQSRLPVDPLSFADASERNRWIREKNMLVFTLFHPVHAGFVVDLFIDSPDSFDAFLGRSKSVTIDGHSVRICSIDDLIRMKEAAGRPQDLTDIAALKRIQSVDH